MTRLAELTTLRLGGPARAVVDCTDTAVLVAALRTLDAAREPVLVLGGGSNIVAADEGFAGTVLRMLTTGIERRRVGGRVQLTAQAGEPWDRLVDRCVADGLAGLECLAGIPGSTGATPMQNVGAYGQEVAETIVGVEVFDRALSARRTLTPAECRFSYRSSIFKACPGRWVVLSVTFALEPSARSAPIRYAELAGRLGVQVGDTSPLNSVREAVLALRRAKGMVLDGTDPDTRSAGSFFLNPILSPGRLEELLRRVRERCGPEVHPPLFAADGGNTKTSAAWLIERAGFTRGYGSPHGIAISGKHTLALTNRGAGTTAELVALAREIVTAVDRTFGVQLKPEPVFVGFSPSLA